MARRRLRVLSRRPLQRRRTPCPAQSCRCTRTSSAASLGGPIARDRTFLFANVEHRALDQSGLVTIPAGSVAVINARLAAVGYAGPAVTTGIYPNPIDTTYVMGKVDHHFSGSDQFSIKYNSYGVTSENARGAGGTSAPSASAGLDNLDQAVAVGQCADVSRTRGPCSKRAGNSRAAISTAPPTDLIGPAVSIAGVAAFGRLSSSPTGAAELDGPGREQPGRTSPAITPFGPAWICSTTTTRSRFPARSSGSYAFASLPNFLAGVYNNAGFTQTFGDTMVSQTNANLGITCRTSGGRARGDGQRRTPLRPAVSGHDRDGHEQRIAAGRRRPGRRSNRAGRSFVRAPGVFTIACRCARWPTPCCPRATRRT